MGLCWRTYAQGKEKMKMKKIDIAIRADSAYNVAFAAAYDATFDVAYAAADVAYAAAYAAADVASGIFCFNVGELTHKEKRRTR